jgi:hypothetical protein
MSLKSFASTLLFGLLYGLAHVPAASAQADQVLPVIGGPGGGGFVARCAPGDILNGFELQTGDDVDSIRPICAAPATATSIGPRHAFTQKFGGDGGSPRQLVCPDAAPAIAGIAIRGEGIDTVIVNDIDIFCSVAVPNQPMAASPTVHFAGEVAQSAGRFAREFHGVQVCPPGLLPVGITGRSGVWLDGFGLICGASPFDPSAIKSVGRIGGSHPAPQRPARPICEAARDARARNSPAAPDLEAQCAASMVPVASMGRVGGGATAPRPQRSICDAAVDARARNSPAAPNLEAQCQAAGGIYKMRPSDADFEVVRARGEAIAARDRSAASIRTSLYDAPRRGFDIGLGIWDGNTADGPGKQRYHDFLNLAEQQGFNFAAAYALPRNKYAGLVDIGSAINAADAEVRAARSASNDGFYWLGFDIASGIFGDPRAGAQGIRGMSSGAIATRESLNDAEQRGFDSSMRLHLSRKYQ